MLSALNETLVTAAFVYSAYYLLSRLIWFGLFSKTGRRLLRRRIRLASSALRTDGPLKANTRAQNITSFPVKYAADKASRSFWSLVPWDATGTLSAAGSNLHFQGNSPLGHQIEMTFDSNDTIINYQKGRFWDAGLSWCIIEANGEKHYFTYDFDQNSAELLTTPPIGTKTLYRELTNRYLRESN